MPVKLGSKLPQENEARIEIIPLIDIMFFLLASFMLISLSMVRLNNVKVELPSATKASSDTNRDLLSISVNRNGFVFIDKAPVAPNELSQLVASMFSENPKLRVMISGDREASHGDIIGVLDRVRATGLQKVAFEISPSSTCLSAGIKTTEKDPEK
jgi:biopolymer transport protein ExbD